MRQHALEVKQLQRLTNDQLYEMMIEFSNLWGFVTIDDVPYVDIGKIILPDGEEIYISLNHRRYVKNIAIDIIDQSEILVSKELTVVQMCLARTTDSNVKVMRSRKKSAFSGVSYRSLFKLQWPDCVMDKEKAGHVACVRLLQLLRFHRILADKK